MQQPVDSVQHCIYNPRPHIGTSALEPFCSESVLRKLTQKHGIGFSEVVEAFANRQGKILEELRTRHRTNPPTLWFISETDYGIKLKVIFVPTDFGPEIKSAYPADMEAMRIYAKYGGVQY